MYAVIQTGGKQYRVAQGETLRVEKLEASAGDKLTFSPLMLTDDAGGVTIGKPVVAGATVSAEVLEQGLGQKIIIFKYRRRKNYRRKQGHRQPFTSLKITSISAA
ncbi:MAG: 50S ribosomal protein L21 [Deltaproteobacteria bacterium]|nr:50S ribosomal protein L21 [Deltaproteobacteria bacterium]